MVNQKILENVRKTGTIPEKKLTLLPVLKTTDNWNKVMPLGLVEHATSFATYRGALVELDGRLYFIRKETIAVLHHDKNWNFPRVIKVT